jgi:SAM-dependent methyltransferase
MSEVTAREDSEFLRPAHRLSFLWGYVARKYLLDAVSRFAESTSGALLDAGCGRQPYRPLFTRVSSYVGVDVPTSAHAFRPGTVLFDGVRLPFQDAAFDVCLSTEVLEHVRKPVDFLRECRRVLRPGGRLLVTVPFVFPQHEAPHDYARYTSFGLVELVRDAGFDDIHAEPLGGYSAAVAHVLGLFATQRLSRFFLRVWAYPLVWCIQRGLLWYDRIDTRPNNDFTLGWELEARNPLAAPES